ncbi:MAG TPA: FAD binding domain-containing protein [Thermoplasmata archaeon]|nr:FAD binding domain-containing protein [Thermoplasmata archaeon]
MGSMLLPAFELHEPRTVEEAAGLARDLGPGKFDFLAGGTDLLPNYKWTLNARPHVISLLRVAGIDTISPTRIGALATLKRIEGSESLAKALPVIPKTAALIASPLIRASGTLGGNLMLENRCFFFNQSEPWRASKGYCMKADGDVCLVVPQKEICYATFSADLPAPLIALGASIELVSAEGKRVVPLSSFYAGDGIARNSKKPGEILSGVVLQQEAQRLRASYQKLRLRDSWDFPEAGVAVAARSQGGVVEELRLVSNAMEMTPRVHDDLTSNYVGRPWAKEWIDELSQKVMESVRPVKNTFFSPEYRKRMTKVLARRALLEVSGPVG